MKRRNFLLSSALTSVAVSSPMLLSGKKPFESPFVEDFGIQLYSVRDDMIKNPKKTLKKLSNFWYKYIEGYEGDMGLFWGMSNIEFKKYLDGLGMQMIASHCGETDNLESFKMKCSKAAEIGVEYLICPWADGKRTVDGFKLIAETFNNCGRIAKQSGINFAYHNHGYSFEKVNGVYLQDVLMNETDKNLVDYEMDIYWVVVAGEDPIKWFDKHPGRFTHCHVKDYLKIDESPGYETCTLGQGIIDFSKIIEHGIKRGLETLIVEQEEYRGSTPMRAAKSNVSYMQNLKF